MNVDLYQLDKIDDYDEAIEAIEDYVEALVDEFVSEKEGLAYLKAYPEMAEYVGSWIDHLIYFAYNYLNLTLPHLTPENVEVVVTELFPKKVSLLNLEDANSAIPELIAFWDFLGRKYQHEPAQEIVLLLKKISFQFLDKMKNPQNFGLAKSFFHMGTEAGFDLTNPEELKQFQESYNNQQIPLNLNNQFPNLVHSLIGKLIFKEIIEELEEEIIEELEEESVELPPISSKTISILEKQKIDLNQPGSILKDFQSLLDFIGEKGIPVSSKQKVLPMKSLAQLNQQLTEPIPIALKRPVQKSYPTINGLYLLLRASGLGQIIVKGKKYFLIKNQEILRIWNNLNPTERYFTLLEAWLIRAHEEILQESRYPYNEGFKCFEYWRTRSKSIEKINSYDEQKILNYYPGSHNLALMKLFGLVDFKYDKPGPGCGWRVKKIQKSAFGNALMGILFHAFSKRKGSWKYDNDPNVDMGELQPYLQIYFPDWQNIVTFPKPQFQAGIYTFKVHLDRAWRRLVIPSHMSLATLSELIIDSFDFDYDHLDMFQYKDRVGRMVEITHPYADGSVHTPEVKIGDLPLAEGETMMYIFDFGDWWEFLVQLETIELNSSNIEEPKVIKSYGKAPLQYPDEEQYY